MPTRVLIAGFGPFPGAPVNPTASLAKRLARRRRPALAGIERIAHVFRTSYAAVASELPALIAEHRPDIVLLFGLAARTPGVRIETRARNRRTSLFADLDGIHPPSAIRAGGPQALHARASQQPIMIAARSAGIPARLSIDAGKYVCNYAYWLALERSRGKYGPLVQFIHVPKIRGASLPRRRLHRQVRQLTSRDLARAGEAILLAFLVAARRRNRDQSEAMRAAAQCVTK